MGKIKSIYLSAEQIRVLKNGYKHSRAHFLHQRCLVVLSKAQGLSSYINESEYLHSICETYIIRNSVHISADIDGAEVLNALKQVLIVYIYLVLKYSTQVNELPNISNLLEISKDASQDNEQKMLYDFLSFGNTSTEIKTQFVNAYILHSLKDKECIEIKNLIDDSNKYFKNKFSNEFYIRRSHLDF